MLVFLTNKCYSWEKENLFVRKEKYIIIINPIVMCVVFMKIQYYSKWNDANITDEQWTDMYDETDEFLIQLSQKETERIGAMDEQSQRQQYEQLFRVIDEYNKLMDLEEERQMKIFHQYLSNLGVIKMDCPFSYQDAIDMWKKQFLKNISEKQMTNCPIDEYLWNIFTYNIIADYKTGNEAKQAFYNAEKNDVYVFSSDDECVYHLNMPNNISVSMLRLLYGRDIYFFDGNFQWTFIIKHEDCNEPIFYQP